MGIRCADHVTPLYPQKLALTSPTGGGRSVGIVRSRTKATEFSFSFRPHPSCQQSKCKRHGDLVDKAYGPTMSTRYDGVEFARGDSNLKEFHRS